MNMIVAVDEKWGIGKNNALLTYIPSDLKYFKNKTAGKVVVMGRKTLESLPGGKGLPKRVNYVLTSNENFEAENCIVVHSEAELFKALEQYDKDEVFLIGGASLYNKYYKLCDRLYITKMQADLDADSFIANIDEDDEFEVESELEPLTENGITYSWLVYKKK